MFTYSDFMINDLHIQLVLPELKHADALIKVIKHDKNTLKRWMPWAKSMKNKQDERKFIKYAREQIANYKLLELIIMVNNVPTGMIDLHNIDQQESHADVGYWLSSTYQGQGIMTESLIHLVNKAFKEMDLHKIILYAEHENKPSRAVAKRVGFKHEALLKDQTQYEGQFKDLDMYSLFKADC